MTIDAELPTDSKKNWLKAPIACIGIAIALQLLVWSRYDFASNYPPMDPSPVTCIRLVLLSLAGPVLLVFVTAFGPIIGGMVTVATLVPGVASSLYDKTPNKKAIGWSVTAIGWMGWGFLAIAGSIT